MKRRGKKQVETDQYEPIPVEQAAEPGFIVPKSWSEEEILDAMKAFEEQLRRERGLPPSRP
ncbi:MAG: hypothetical protein AAB074_11835 [Planctomycetota bacterium]